MTSGKFAVVPVSSIVVNREERQRRELTGIEELAESIAARGLINPIVIDRDHVLIAGERRLSAHKHLGLLEITVQYIEDLSDLERRLIELEENAKRHDLAWLDYTNALAEIHQINSQLKSDWSVEDTARSLGISYRNAHRQLTVHRNLDKDIVKNADVFSTAYNAATRFEERRATSGRRDVENLVTESLGLPPSPEKATAAPVNAEILNGNFIEYAATYTGPQFNLIHCDFPYGISTGDKSGQSSAKSTGSYADTPEVYFELLKTLCHADNIVADSAHLIFWFSMEYYSVTKTMLEKAGWKILSRPLIWHKSDNTGILPDPNRGPRQTYETAFFGYRGDRKIVRAVANSISAPTTREFHTSEKPREVLRHFLRMVTDENSRVLDPTAGSGNAIRVLSELGADYALGIELNPEFAATANDNVSRAEKF